MGGEHPRSWRALQQWPWSCDPGAINGSLLLPWLLQYLPRANKVDISGQRCASDGGLRHFVETSTKSPPSVNDAGRAIIATPRGQGEEERSATVTYATSGALSLPHRLERLPRQRFRRAPYSGAPVLLMINRARRSQQLFSSENSAKPRSSTPITFIVMPEECSPSAPHVWYAGHSRK